jgi:zinc protease
MKAIQILFATAALTIAAPASAELDLRRADVSHLPIGLTVIMLEDHSFPVVSVQMLYKSGSAAEITGKTGLAHFLEHLAFRGSANFPKAGATEAIYDAGGEWHGYTAMDQTTYFATMPKDGLELLLKIEADRMARTVIDPASIEAEKGAVITELHSYENDPSGVLQDAVVRTALQSHPYGSPMAGYVSDIERLTISDAQAYYASHYAPGNAVLAISGDIDLKQAKALVERAFANVAARPIAQPHLTAELPQRGERRTQLLGPVDRQYFQLAFPAPAASNRDFAAFLVLQQVLAGTPGVNPRQSGWSGTRAIEGSLLFGTTRDIATWLPATRDPFLFMISGSIEPTADSGKLEEEIAKRIDGLRDRPVSPTQLANAKAAVARILRADVLTTEDAAHQLAYFEGIGALDALLDMNRHVQSVTAAYLKRVAWNYIAPDRLTVGWMAPGNLPVAALGSGNPKPAADRSGAPANSETTTQPELRRLPGGLSAIVQSSPLSDTVTVELLLDSPVKDGERPSDLPGLGTVSRSGEPSELSDLLDEVIAASRSGPASAESKSDDPETRLQQLIAAQIGDPTGRNGRHLAVIVSGNIATSTAFGKLEQKLGQAAPGKIGPSPSPTRGPNVVRERIAKPLSQGGLGYVVDGPQPGTREALAWQMMLYVLTHDYSGRLGRSAITEKGLVYHIYSSLRTNGRQTWATIWTGVDPDKADAMEIELRTQIATLASEPPTAAEIEAARNHILGRDVTAAQSNDELATKLMREFVETGGVRSHEQLRLVLKTITARDLAKAAKTFTKGTILRVDVGAPGN